MKTQYLKINDTISLAHYDEYLDDSRIGVVLIHGLAEHKGRYSDFIKQLLIQGISVFAIDLRGHGESTGKRGDVKNFNDYVGDLHLFICNIKLNYPQLKLTIFGHSLGGLLACVYSSLYDTVDLLILSSPLVEAPKRTKALRLIPYKMLGFIKLKKRHSESREMLAYSMNDPLTCRYFTLRLLGVIFDQGISSFKDNIERIKLPMLVIGGEDDNLINSGHFSYIFNQYVGPDITIEIFKNAKHRLVQNNRKDDIIEYIIKWLDKHSHE